MRNFYIDKEICDELATEIQKFVDECNGETENAEEICFTFNSGGGSVSAGMAIHDALASLTAPTVARIVGLCASAATYGALACDRVEMARNAHFLVHPVTGGLYGTIDEICKDLDYMEELEARMLALYTAKTGLDLEAVKAIVARGEYLDA